MKNEVCKGARVIIEGGLFIRHTGVPNTCSAQAVVDDDEEEEEAEEEEEEDDEEKKDDGDGAFVKELK